MAAASSSEGGESLPSWVRTFALSGGDTEKWCASSDFQWAARRSLRERRRSSSTNDDPDSGIQLSTPSDLMAALSSHQMTSTPIKSVSHGARMGSHFGPSAKRSFNSLSAVENMKFDGSLSETDVGAPASQDTSVSTVIKRKVGATHHEGEKDLLKTVERSLEGILHVGDQPEAKKAISNFLSELSRLFPTGGSPRQETGNHVADETSSDMDITRESDEDGDSSQDETARDLLSDALATGTVTDPTVGTTAASSTFFHSAPVKKTTMATPASAHRINDTSTYSSGAIDEFITPLVDSSALEMSRNFRSSYAEWIAKMFDSQLANMKLKLESQFQEELKRARDEKNREISELHENYERKLAGCRGTSERLETQLKRAARDFIHMNEVKSKQIKELKSLLELEQQRSAEKPNKEDFELAWEGQRLALQQRHTEKLKTVVESTRGKLQEIQDHYQTVNARLQEELYQVARERDAIRHELVDAKTKLKRLECRMMKCSSCVSLAQSPSIFSSERNLSRESCLNGNSRRSVDSENDTRRRSKNGNSADASSEAETEYLSLRTRSEVSYAEDSTVGKTTTEDTLGKTNGSVLSLLDSMKISLAATSDRQNHRGSLKNTSVSSEPGGLRSSEELPTMSPTISSPGQLAQMSAKLRQHLKSLETSLNRQEESERRASLPLSK